MPQPHGAAAPAQRPGATLMSVAFKTSPLENYCFGFCLPHHAHASVIAWRLKTKA
jgi:hypothetical protein